MLTISMELYPNHVQQNAQWVYKANSLYQISEAMRALDNQKKLLEEELKLLSEFQNSKGGGFIYTRTTSKGPVQYKNIPELLSVDLEAYRGAEIERWKLERK